MGSGPARERPRPASDAEDPQAEESLEGSKVGPATQGIQPRETVSVRVGPDETLVQIPVWHPAEFELSLVAVRNGELRARPTEVPGRVIIDATLPYLFKASEGLRQLETPITGLAVTPKSRFMLATSEGDFVESGRLIWWFDQVKVDWPNRPLAFTWSPQGWSQDQETPLVRSGSGIDVDWEFDRTKKDGAVTVELVRPDAEGTATRVEVPGSPFPEHSHFGIVEIGLEIMVSGDTTWVYGGLMEDDAAYLAALDAAQFRRIPLEVEGQALRGYVDAVAVDSQGRLWLAVDGRVLVRLPSGQLRGLSLPDPRTISREGLRRIGSARPEEWLSNEYEAQHEFEAECLAWIGGELWVTLLGMKRNASPRALYKSGGAASGPAILPSVASVHDQVSREPKSQP